ncbi:MAG: substrate-binding domain-containing protein [Planctomycetes bacterium]|nr:substrate-binding domain-containing protein [Planctomycetota bacterium]
MSKHGFPVWAWLLASVLSVGCETREEISTPANSGAAASGQSALSRKKSITIGMIAKSKSNPIFLAAQKGAEDRAAELSKELGLPVTIRWDTPNDEDAQRQAEIIEQLTGSGVDAITIACSDASKVTRAIDDAIAKGVPVMCFDSDAPESKRLCYVGTDDVEAGRAVMRAVAELLGDKPGVIAILAGNQTATNLQKRVRGAEEELATHPHLKLKKVYYHKETPQDAFAEIESAQKANPEINGWAMIGGWPLMTERALPWNAQEVVCVSMDTLPAQLKHLRMGDVQILLGQQYYYFGRQCVSVLVGKVLEGRDPDNVIDFAPLDRVTRENVDDYEKK